MRAIEVERCGIRGHVSIPLDGSPLLQGLCKKRSSRRREDANQGAKFSWTTVVLTPFFVDCLLSALYRFKRLLYVLHRGNAADRLCNLAV
jgi:hypothetical protein